MLISQEQREEHKAIVRRYITLNPSWSVIELQRRMREAPKALDLSRDYLTKIVQQVRADRIAQINEETKEDIYGQLRDLVEFVNQNLRAIAQEEKIVIESKNDKLDNRIMAQNNRIKALNSVVDNTVKLLQMKMDLGIIERKLGTADVRFIDAMSAIKQIRNGDYSTPLRQLIPTHVTTGESGETGTDSGTD